MFYILRKRVRSKELGDTCWDRYFRTWDGARCVMDCEVCNLTDKGYSVTEKLDRWNGSEGLREYETEIEQDGVTIRFAIISGYFWD